MSQQKEYILAENVDDGVGFDLRGKKYFLRYPVVSEIKEIQNITDRIDEAEKSRKENPEVYEARSDELEDFLYGLISPVDHDEDIKEAIARENVRVYRNFNTMIKTELSLQA